MIIADISFGPPAKGTMLLLKYTFHYYLYPQLKSMTGLLRAEYTFFILLMLTDSSMRQASEQCLNKSLKFLLLKIQESETLDFPSLGAEYIWTFLEKLVAV